VVGGLVAWSVVWFVWLLGELVGLFGCSVSWLVGLVAR